MEIKRFIRKTLTIFLTFAVMFVGVNIYSTTRPANVLAVGDLEITYLGVPLGDPIFEVENMAPGDSEDRDVVVTNNGTIARFVAVKGVRTGGVGTDPKLETVLDIVISEGGTDLYGGGSPTGAKTVQDLFNDSADPNGVQLSIVNPGDTTTYNFKVTFPESADNEFQGKSVIFDLTFGIITGENIVINEVYYLVDEDHGLDSPKDRGILGVNGNNVSIIIQGNGAGSTNIVNVNIRQVCTIIQSNNANIQNNVNVNANTGSNNASNNSGPVSIVTGAINTVVNIFNFGNINIASCGKKLGQNHEWIELFNPTEETISLKKWTITDNSGISRTIPGSRRLGPGEFALLSKDNATWNFWNEDPDATKIPLGQQIGDGLDNAGDRLILRNAQGTIVDQLSYGDDTTIFDPSIPLVLPGNSFERLVPGFDTNAATDFEEQTPPTPGN